MSDEKLRRELISLGYTPGPITDTTRRVLEKKLEKLRVEAKKSQSSSRTTQNVRRSRKPEPLHDSEEEDDDDETTEAQTPDRRRQSSRQYQSPKETASRKTMHGESSQRTDGRVDGTGYNRFSIDNPDRSALSYNRYSTDILDSRSALSYNRYSTDNPERSTLSYNRFSVDNPDSGALGYNRYSTGNPDRSSLSYNRYSADNPDSGALGYNRYFTDIPDRSSLSYNKYSADNPDRSPLGYNRHSTDDHDRSTPIYDRNFSDSFEKKTLGFPKSLTDEVRYRQSSRDQSTSSYLGSSKPALESFSQKTNFGFRPEKVSQPVWSKKLEYYLSRLLRVLCVILFLVFTGILIVKCGILTTSQDDSMKLLPSDCNGREDPFCKAKQMEITLQILSELYDFLSLEAGSFECGNPSGLSSKCVPINRAKEYVKNVTGYAAEKFDSALDWMLSKDKHLGIWAKGEDSEELVTTRENVFCVESSQPRLGFVCRLKNALYTAISNLFMALLGIFILWIIMIFLRHHWQKLEEEEKQMFAMVEKIIDVVKQHYNNWTLAREQYPYVGILHVRDSLIMPQDRKHLKRVWDRAVQFVEDNESRVRTELKRVEGADLRVWRWT
ncbi:LEM domain-containing protein 2 [Leptodactylus fuscus]|uniref:LEM domain-containing protein 2 n=1 Tax=Leptodactylus fuscus TaxID=238119 RepID=UPI003F4EEA80